jgi:hypothetical protein
MTAYHAKTKKKIYQTKKYKGKKFPTSSSLLTIQKVDASDYQVRGNLSKFQQIFQSILHQENGNNTLHAPCLSDK